MAAVVRRTPKSAALTQCSARSARSNRTTKTRSDGSVVTAVRLSDPRVDVIAPVFPVARTRLRDDGDLLQPLARLVAVHGRHVEASGASVDRREGLSFHLVG